MRVLVCGGRDYADKDAVWSALDDALEEVAGSNGTVLTVIQGGARGADRLAADWAMSAHPETVPIRSRVFHADWKEFGPAAGPIRNARMIDEGKPDLVIAFPGGRGTADMVRRAKTAGVKVVEVRPCAKGGRG